MEKGILTHEQHNREILDSAFGAEAEFAYHDRAFLFAALKSESWKQRYCAIQFLLEYWKLGQDILWPLYKNHFANEHHPQVQLITLRKIGQLYCQTFDEVACRFLARIALSDQFENQIRREAFESINEIRKTTAIDRQFDNPSVDELIERFESIKKNFDESRSEELPDWDIGLLRELATG